MILQIFFEKVLCKKKLTITNITIQLKGDKKNDKTDEATWCILFL
ncbi:MAG: hypothetical protein ABI834_00410 [Ginsengibacter sp.]